MEIINAAIEKLKAPDPMSRDPEHEGRRIVRIDGHRDWGWEIVNWDKYEEIRSAQDGLDKSRTKKRNKRAKVAELGQSELPIPQGLQPTQDASLSPHPSSSENQNQNQNQRGGVTFSHDLPQSPTEGTQEGTQRDTRCLLVSKTWEFAAAVADWDAERRAFIPYTATWLNQDRFRDDPEVWETHHELETPRVVVVTVGTVVTLLVTILAFGHRSPPPERLSPPTIPVPEYAGVCNRNLGIESRSEHPEPPREVVIPPRPLPLDFFPGDQPHRRAHTRLVNDPVNRQL